ncbi:unnamed protein product [Rodentolepis nana]|uniref:RING-type domain-containing protein n=1 Tax=Rodentolepis nana TaxID=102285 RepID=A0A0R3TZJ5_RODNA|nr:unnamed protein product [Rodentolepis nana]
MAESTLCVICLTPLVGTTGSPLTCGHEFHIGCLQIWSKSNSIYGRCKCPLATCGQIFDCMQVKAAIPGERPKYLPVEDNYVCKNCSRLLNSPAFSTNGCEHYFCAKCISELRNKRPICPVEKSVFTDIKVSACVGAPIVATITLANTRSPLSGDDLENIFNLLN